MRTRVTTDVGKRVRKYRLIKDLTQEQLGFDVGCGDSQISHIQNWDRRWSLNGELNWWSDSAVMRDFRFGPRLVGHALDVGLEAFR